MTETVAEPKDIVEDVIELVDTTTAVVTSNKTLVYAGIAFVASATGAALGVYFAKRKLEKEYNARAEKERAEARDFYARRHKVGEYADPSVIAAQYEPTEDDAETVREITRSYQSDDISEARIALRDQPPHETETSDVVEGTVGEEAFNVFKGSNSEGDFDYEAEVAQRTEEAPYVITYDEWSANESDYEQSTLTYFAGDDTLADSTDGIISDTDDTVGDDNLLRFGHGSRDNNIVYIRNDRLELEWEVIRSPGRYAKEVLGFDDSEEEIRHSYRDKRPRRFRSDDD